MFLITNFHNFLKIIWKKKILWLQNHFIKNSFPPKIFIKHFLVKNVWWENVSLLKYYLKNIFLIANFHIFFKKFGKKKLWLQNHFLVNNFPPKIFTKKKMLSKIFIEKCFSLETLIWWHFFWLTNVTRNIPDVVSTLSIYSVLTVTQISHLTPSTFLVIEVV